MRFMLLLLALLSFPVMGAETVSLKNDREGTSYYSGRSEERSIKKALKSIDGANITRAYQDSIKTFESNKLCSFDFNSTLLKNLKKINPRFSELDGAILYLRSQNEFDDVVTKLLLRAYETETNKVFATRRYDDLSYPEREVMDSSLDVLEKFEKKIQLSCLDESYKSLHGDLKRLDKNLNKNQIEAIFIEAYERRVISLETYLAIQKARINDLELSTLTLKAYYKKVRTLRTQYPLRDPTERSTFVTQKANKEKVTYRQRLHESYSDLQIVLMANIIKKLRTRLESPKAEILIYDRNRNIETITLEPMERFRLAIKLLRKEMSLLALNTYFNGRAPDYMDLMSAAYETGIIPASELEEVAGLQDIWNPKKTFWQKAEIWVRTFSTVATIALPPPYGFVPALAVVVIEMTAGKKDDNTNDPTVLF